MIFDQTGSLAATKRHDYLPFGEELYASQGGRTTALGYTGDIIRQKFTQKERDVETGLDYFLARYYSSTQGRFTSPDEFTGGPDELYNFTEDAADNPTFYAELDNPQSLNKYQYTYNNPLNLTDDDGHCPKCWVALEIALSAKDVKDTIDTFNDPNASTSEKVVSVLSTAAGVIGPLGGYNSVRKGVNNLFKQETKRELKQEATETVVKKADDAVDTGEHHVANVRVLEDGKTVSKSREVSGNMTPEQKKMGFPKGQLDSHTEPKAIRNTPVKQGQTMVITGTRRPCPTCKGRMNQTARQTGARIRY